MNSIVIKFLNILIFATIRLFVWDKVTFEEVKKRRYSNDSFYSPNLNSWNASIFLHSQSGNRINGLKGKLSSLLSISSILVAIFSVTGTIVPDFPIWIQAICIVLAVFSVIYCLAPLTISSSQVVDLEALNSAENFTEEVKNDFKKTIIDMDCKSDFNADCLKVVITSIILSLVFFTSGTLFTISSKMTISSATDVKISSETKDTTGLGETQKENDSNFNNVSTPINKTLQSSISDSNVLDDSLNVLDSTLPIN